MVTRDYIAFMKVKKIVKYTESKSAVSVLKDAVSMPGIGLTVPVRTAKAKLSALLDLVEGGREITITSDGKPKAILMPIGKRKVRKVFAGMGDYLKSMPMQTEGPFADEIIRADRDSRGW